MTGAGNPLNSPLLDPEQERALEFLVEASRRADRQPFYGSFPVGSHNIRLAHSGVPRDHSGIYPGDLDTLAEAGLVRVDRYPDTVRFDVTPAGFRYYGEIKGRTAKQGAAVPSTTRSYLDTGGFIARHSKAFVKWQDADGLLWSAESYGQLTTIGHLCREAMQEFATSLIRSTTASAPEDPAKTVARVRAALGTRNLMDGTRSLLDSLIAYWGAVADLSQRQEHGGQKEGQPLKWEDGRRLVFHTLFTMVEIDRAAL